MQATLVKPPLPKHTSKELGGKLVISIPGLRFGAVTFVLGVWLLMWLILGAALLIAFVSPSNPPSSSSILTLSVFLLAWLVLGFLVLWNFAWNLAGRELVTISDHIVTITRAALSIRWSKEYSGEYVRGLRATSSNMSLNNGMIAWSAFSFSSRRDHIGAVAFDYGAATFRFGAGIDEAEAKQIVAEIQQKFPQYRSGDPSQS